MRVYVASTLEALKSLSGNGFAAPVAAHAVTPALREWYADGDAEELEYAAADEAAESSLRLLAAQPVAPRRRVVVAVDVPDAAVRLAPGGAPGSAPGDEPGDVSGGSARSAVSVDATVTVADVASVHVDDGDAAPDVQRAVDALAAADAGDEDARFDVDGAAGHELLWYDVSELDDVLALR